MKNYTLGLFLILQSFVGLCQSTDWSKKDWTDPKTTEFWEIKPKYVTPAAESGKAPSDAIVLFDGKNMDQWVMVDDKSPCKWTLKNGEMITKLKTGSIETKRLFGDCQLHVEFKIPENAKFEKDPNNAGNSGVYLQSRYEVQIFDSYMDEVPLYSNGQMGSIYKQAVPMVNACKKPGSWESFDIFFTAPTFFPNGALNKPAFITVLQNGILILNHFQIQGTIDYVGYPKYEPHGPAPLHIQGHGSEVSFRNIWIREI